MKNSPPGAMPILSRSANHPSGAAALPFIPPRSAQHSRPITLPASSSVAARTAKNRRWKQMPRQRQQHRLPPSAPIAASSRLTLISQTGSRVTGRTKVESAVMPYRIILTLTNCAAPDLPKSLPVLHSASLSPVCFWQSASQPQDVRRANPSQYQGKA